MEFIHIDEIKTDNKYLRLDSDVEKLKKSIETVGLINPLVLNLDNKLIAGGRRYSAMKEMGMSEVPVVRIDKKDLEQELISIDENLIRMDLSKVEFEKCLSRGLEIYEKLYPEATKFESEDLETKEAQEINKELPNDKRSFIDLTAEKTGLSKKVIKSAIEREEKASAKVKTLRAHGELNASQTNEIIKLDKDAQEQIAELIPGKSAKDIRHIVKSIRQKGVEDTIEEIESGMTLPKEYQSLGTLVARSNKVLGKILFEEIRTEHDDLSKILESISTLRISLDQLTDLLAKAPVESERDFSDSSHIHYNVATNSEVHPEA